MSTGFGGIGDSTHDRQRRCRFGGSDTASVVRP